MDLDNVYERAKAVKRMARQTVKLEKRNERHVKELQRSRLLVWMCAHLVEGGNCGRSLRIEAKRSFKNEEREEIQLQLAQCTFCIILKDLLHNKFTKPNLYQLHSPTYYSANVYNI